jgi:hypothetical protein
MCIQCKNLSSRLLRRGLIFEEHDFTIHYLPGKIIPHADFLFSIHKSKSIEGGERGEESVGHQQADRTSDEDTSPAVVL